MAVPESNTEPQSCTYGTLSMVVSERRKRPGGRNPLSRSSSHSCPSNPLRSTARSPGSSRATSVLRQKRSRAYSAGTMIGSLRQAFTVKMVPVSAFSGCDPSGLKERESRQAPVHTSGIGSILAQARVIRIGGECSRPSCCLNERMAAPY